MSHFYGEIKGTRGSATRQGHKSSGLRARGAGWDIGANVDLYYNGKLDRNELTISIDHGNGYNGSGQVESFTFAVTREGIKQI